ncbi:hypothetical protein M8445_18175 (plasmid) [Deinococcus aquaticus]|uniref:Uncharacterized protein n=1 Tax=Deinococcus aquaticus TaxID=328692 RepID=A0ABY7V7S5_9DEIO|nr:hypothetical protein [Deinococcus aquaticus]WDA60759.1 hypothetical protein M8445_18175 [Deinococcus aquaticus]
MPSYYDWNTALIEHVTHGAPLGSTVYLEVSEDTLERVGVQRWGVPGDGGTWAGDFLAAVQESAVRAGRVDVSWMHGGDPQGWPLGVAFLGAMVLAASQMQTDVAAAVHERNYFRRLGGVLGVGVGSQGRPPGLPVGEEEPLWAAWVRFLRARGFDSTARGGEGPQRFIRYPISQSLVSAAERARLMRVFAERAYPAGWDGETVTSRLRADGAPSVKVRELLQRTGSAAEDVQSALLDVLQAFHASGGAGGVSAALSARQLVAGLYRDEDWRGDVVFSLFPRQPRGVRLADLVVEVRGVLTELRVERPGFYQPFGEVRPEELSVGTRFPVVGSAFVDALVLPAREFWLLRPDPDNAGMFASLGMPGVGERVVLLLAEPLLADVRRFREEGLLGWAGEPVAVGAGWVELRDVMVTGNHWAEVPAGNAGALHDALRPAGGVSVHVQGGVRTQRAGAYLVGGAPAVSVSSFFSEAFLTVCRGGREIYAEPVVPGEEVVGVLDEVGEYELTGESRGVRAVRLVSVVPWEALRVAAAAVTPDMGVDVGTAVVQGAQVFAK